MTSIILANAIYLKAKWGTPFDESDTDDETFRLLNHEDVQVPTMWDRGRYACVATDDIEVLRKPYSGGAFELVVVLPRAGRFEEVRGTLTFQSVCDALAATQPIDTILKLPKFSIESTPEIDPFLQSRGAVESRPLSSITRCLDLGARTIRRPDPTQGAHRGG